MKHFLFKDNGCQCLDCRAMYDGERWLELTRTKGVEAAEAYSEETKKRRQQR